MPTDRIKREVAWVAGLLFAGLVILPVSIYLVGRAVFGEYGGGGLGEFYAGLLGRFLHGEPAAWFLLLSPCLLWLLGRLTIAAFRRAGRPGPPVG
jgi:hypothetical protein